jgi:GPH family glycoside/pentoside/hexuronide:cation symporter
MRNSVETIVSTLEADPTALNEFSVPHGSSSQSGGLSTARLFGFSIGMIGDRIFRDAPALLLMVFMTDYLAIPPAFAGAAIFIPKMLIIFVDPFVGTVSDRMNTRWGRRLPFMFVGSLLASLAIVMFFHVPRLSTPLLQAVYMSFMVLVGFTGYSLYSVPYLTMASEIADTDNERRKIMSWRVIFMALGLSLSAFAGGFMQMIGGGMTGYATMSWVYAAICLVTMLATVFAAGRAHGTRTDQIRLSLFGQFRLVAANERYLRLLLIGFLQKLGEGVGYGSFAYFCIYVVRQPLGGMGLVVLASTAGQVLAQPLWLRASRRWVPTTLYSVGVLGWCINLLLWLAMDGRSQLWLIPLGLQAGASAGGFLMVTLSMLSNTMAADAAESGENREGVYSGIWLASEKLAFALGALVVGIVMSLFGFLESANGVAVPQTQTAIMGIAVAYCGVNILVYLSSVLAAFRFARLERKIVLAREPVFGA